MPGSEADVVPKFEGVVNDLVWFWHTLARSKSPEERDKIYKLVRPPLRKLKALAEQVPDGDDNQGSDQVVVLMTVLLELDQAYRVWLDVDSSEYVLTNEEKSRSEQLLSTLQLSYQAFRQRSLWEVLVEGEHARITVEGIQVERPPGKVVSVVATGVLHTKAIKHRESSIGDDSEGETALNSNTSPDDGANRDRSFRWTTS